MASQTEYSHRTKNALAIAKRHKFDYESVRRKFMSACQSYHKRLLNKKNIPHTREEIETTIGKIKENILNSDLSNAYNLKIAECNGENILIYQCKTQGDRRIISMEEAFDLFVEEHLTYRHRSARDMWDSLNYRYYLPRPWLNIFVQFCKCSISFNEIIQIDILSTEFANHFDGNFKHVLLYVDKGTEFSIIRPLTSKSEDELTVEILKIFTDFNVPRLVEVYPNYRLLFETVFANVEKVLGKLSIYIFPTSGTRGNTDTQITRRVKRELQQWISTNKSNNWAIGCHIVQHKLNNTIFKKNSPYDCVFMGTLCKTEKKLQDVEIDYQEISDEEDFVLRLDDNDENDDVKPNIEKVDIEEHGITEQGSIRPSEPRTSQAKKGHQISTDVDWEETPVTELSMEVNAGEEITEKTRDHNDSKKVLDECCCECGKIVTTSVNYCNKCKKIVHLLCSHRIVKIIDSTANVTLLCKLCFDVDSGRVNATGVRPTE